MKYLVMILSKTSHLYVKMLQKYLNNNDIEALIVTDSPSQNICYPDEELLDVGFSHMTYHTKKDPTAWDKAFYHIYENNLGYDYYYFLEEDVYCDNFQVFVNIFKTLEDYHQDLISHRIKTIEEDPKWNNWYEPFIESYQGVEGDPMIHSFNPFSRVSGNLINKIFEFYDKHKRLYFHEFLLPIICVTNNLTFVDFKEDDILKEFFGGFDYISHKTWGHPDPEFGDKLFLPNKIVHPRKHMRKI